MIIKLRRENVVSSLLGKDWGELEVFGKKDNLGFGSFGSYCKFDGSGETSDDWRSKQSKAGFILNDLLDSSVFPSSADKSRLLFPLVVFIKVGVGDGININMIRRLSGRLVEGCCVV